MKIKRALLFVALTLIFFTCMVAMNKKYDRLSRYPYQDEEARKLIDRYLTDEEIDYIIDYSIDPSYFIRYVKAGSFNIYHVDTYDRVSLIYWYLSDDNVVNFSEKLYEHIEEEKLDEAIDLLHYYSYEEMVFYLNNGDVYVADAKLVKDPERIDLKLDNSNTVSCHTPLVLESWNDIALTDAALSSFKDALDTINATYKCDNYGGIVFEKSYLSYDELVNIHKTDENVVPGHNDHQLGLCIDLNLESSIFNDNAKYIGMKKIFKENGFEIEDCEFSDCHVRYIGH